MPTTTETELAQEMIPNGIAGAKLKKVLISAPWGVDTRSLQSLLTQRGAESYLADEHYLPGLTMSAALVAAIGEADLVIGVLEPLPAANNVLLEIGMALGLGKRVLLLSTRTEGLPPVLRGEFVLRGSLVDVERIEFALDQILTAPSKRQGPVCAQIFPPQTHPIGKIAEGLLKELQADSPLTMDHLGQIVCLALRSSGVTIFSGPTAAGAIGVWSDDFEPWLGNPVLIHVRANLNTEGDWEKTNQELTRHLGESGTYWGVLICHGAFKPRDKRGANDSAVLAIPAEVFLQSLKETSLGELFGRLRNERAHRRN